MLNCFFSLSSENTRVHCFNNEDQWWRQMIMYVNLWLSYLLFLPKFNKNSNVLINVCKNCKY
jgi:hypothetical protein